MNQLHRAARINLVVCVLVIIASVAKAIDLILELISSNESAGLKWTLLIISIVVAAFFVYSAYKDWKIIRKK